VHSFEDKVISKVRQGGKGRKREILAKCSSLYHLGIHLDLESVCYMKSTKYFPCVISHYLLSFVKTKGEIDWRTYMRL
jgi:hypothetical protein